MKKIHSDETRFQQPIPLIVFLNICIVSRARAETRKERPLFSIQLRGLRRQLNNPISTARKHLRTNRDPIGSSCFNLAFPSNHYGCCFRHLLSVNSSNKGSV